MSNPNRSKQNRGLQTEVDGVEDSAERAERFLELTRRYTDFTELTAPILHEFVQKIIIHERAEKNKQFTTQKMEIHLNFIGRFPIPLESADDELDPNQAERERKRDYHREYRRRLKENGGKPLTSPDTRTPEQIAADEAEKREQRKEYQRRLAREKREAKAAETEAATAI